jgi:hypothetical protein
VTDSPAAAQPDLCQQMQSREARYNDAVESSSLERRERAACLCAFTRINTTAKRMALRPVLSVQMGMSHSGAPTRTKQQQNAWHSGSSCLCRRGCRTQAHPLPSVLLHRCCCQCLLIDTAAGGYTVGGRA